MRLNTSFLARTLALGLGSLAFSSLLTDNALAQYRPSGSQDPFQQNEVNPNNYGLGNGFDPMSLIHNANLSRGRNFEDFVDDTNQNLNKAAEDFKRQQQQQLQQGSTGANILPITPNSSVNP